MSNTLQYSVVDGIKCYSADVATTYTDYPASGFDLTDKMVADSWWVKSRNRLFKRIVLRYLVASGKTHYLDIGCGTGDFIQQIVAIPDVEITGSEVYLKGLMYAKKNIPSVDFVQYDVTQGDIGKSRFHIISAFDVVEHIDNDSAALRHINEMLNKDGVLIISVPQHKFLWGSLDELVKHKRRYSRQELVAKLATNNFDIVKTTFFVFTLFPLMLVARMFDRGGNQAGRESESLEKKTQFSGTLNRAFNSLMRIDEALINLGVSLPFGGTLVVIARKR